MASPLQTTLNKHPSYLPLPPNLAVLQLAARKCKYGLIGSNTKTDATDY